MEAAPPFNEEICPNCGNFVTTENFSLVTGWCLDCTPPQVISNWFAKNADHIEHYIKQGYDPRTSYRLVRQELNPTCVVCGERMPRSRGNSVFCRRHPECRRQSRKYVYLYRERGLSKAAALAVVLSQLTGD